jgi:hypothetical protein
MLGPALHVMNDLNILAPSPSQHPNKNLTFESMLQPLNRRYRLQSRFNIGAVGYIAD